MTESSPAKKPTRKRRTTKASANPKDTVAPQTESTQKSCEICEPDPCSCAPKEEVKEVVQQSAPVAPKTSPKRKAKAAIPSRRFRTR